MSEFSTEQELKKLRVRKRVEREGMGVRGCVQVRERERKCVRV